MAGQVLSMNVNGRLTAPPRVEVALVTNSVDGMVFGGRMVAPTTRGTTLASFSTGTCLGTRTLRGAWRVGVRAGGRADAGAEVLREFDPVSATHLLSASQGVAAGS
jgi:hypothetical protein